MPRIEVDETQFLNSQATVNAVTGMLNHPAARKMLLQARKLADPNAVIPELDAAAPIEASVAELKAQIQAERAAEKAERAAELKAERESREAERAERAAEREAQKQAEAIAKFRAEWDAQKSRLRDDGWRDEGIAAIERHAEERGIADLEIAAAHWEKLHPPESPVQPSGTGSWGFMDKPPESDTFMKAMIESQGENEQALNAEVDAALRDYRSQQTQGWRR